MNTPDKEVQTPVIDQLVKDGVELDRHYVHKVRCKNYLVKRDAEPNVCKASRPHAAGRQAGSLTRCALSVGS